jgi:glyoxylase-like metal-dependent hydrolase (beta-lactamase superfamily II)
VLIDTGAGNKENDKFHEIYGVENRAEDGATQLEEGLRQLGFAPDDIALVINSHLHFDHAGGNTTLDAKGRVALTFPNARYVVQAGEYEYANHTNERTAGSYFPHNFVPVRESGRFDLVVGEKEVVNGISILPTPGHTPYHQGIRLESDGEVAFYIADLVPTSAHLPLPWIMGYDVEPLVTLETKRRILSRATQEEWLIVFEHDAVIPWSRITHDGKAYALLT